jgi:hypothetical protein
MQQLAIDLRASLAGIGVPYVHFWPVIVAVYLPLLHYKSDILK